MCLQKSMQSKLHSEHRAGVSQGIKAVQVLPRFPQVSSLLAAAGAGQRGREREYLVIPRGIPSGRACGVPADCSLNHIKSFLVFFQLGTTEVPTRP